MIGLKVTLVVGAMVLLAGGMPGAQDRTPANGDPATVRAGQGLFRERCAECHGADAKGVTGHDLTRLFASGATDDRVFQTIRSGVPNTIMPSSSAPDAELSALVAYLRSLTDAAPASAAKGNTDNGERMFWSTCGSCHAVGVRGGHLGPDLSRIGQSQSREALTQAIRAPKASVAGSYQPVTLVTRDGQRIRGAKKSEDAFSIQIMDTHEQLQGYLKANLKDVVHDSSSLMPAFGPDRLNDRDLDDLLLYLNTLRAAGPATGRGAGRGRAGR
jgi:putative heme-binding domain-containing protein